MLTFCALFAQKAPSAQKLEKNKVEHKKWYFCYIVKQPKDTIFVYVKPDFPDFNRVSAGILLYDPSLTIGYGDGQEEKIHPRDFKEMYVYSTLSRYMVIADESESYLAKVVVDSTCILLKRDMYNVNVAADARSANPTPGTTEVSLYYTLYKGTLTKVFSGLWNLGVEKKFREASKQAFADCPEVISLIENGAYQSKDIEALVKKFNQCNKN